MRFVAHSLIVCLSWATVATAGADEWTVHNPTKNDYRRTPVRLNLSPPSEPFVVTADGQEVPYQLQRDGDATTLWVAATVPPGGAVTYAIKSGEPAAVKPTVTVRRDGDYYLLDNGAVAVRVPAVAADGGAVPGPLAGVRLGERWVTASRWQTAARLKRFAATVTGDGTVFAAVRLRYDFAGLAGPKGDTPAFAEVEIRLAPEWRHVESAEHHAMAAGSFWELDASADWSPDKGRSVPFSRGPGSGSVTAVPGEDRPLTPGGLPFQDPELFINLQPRWNQHYKDGWFFAATDGKHALGIMPVRAGQWRWPHDNTLHVVVREGGDYAGIRCRTQRGARLWWLLPGPADSVAGRADLPYYKLHGFESLDKLNHDFILDWPGVTKGGWFTLNPYKGTDINPTDVIRRIGRAAAQNAGKPGDLNTLYRVQVLLHPDTYGSSWHFWSPENPNFFTDFMAVPVLLTTGLKAHPQFERLRSAAEAAVREDVYHSVTLPGGAGQECPGYMAGKWATLAPLLREHLGFDPTTWPRMQAREAFRRRTSQPDGPGRPRRMLPMGDTHPADDGPKLVEVPAEEVAAFVTQELPGFGVVFANRPGTPRETYLAFKAGPNRGHYHGDQLSFHYAANAAPVAVDHHCSYSPRAGQEHMHNRMAFWTSDQPYLNMDGYERLIAFKASDAVDVAVGQVASSRLRATQPLPPEIWHQEFPQVPLTQPLRYRRTVVLIKGGPQDILVLRDQWHSRQADLRAAFCLHVRDEQTLALLAQDDDATGQTDGTAVLRDPVRDFEKLGVKPGWILHLGYLRKGKGDPKRGHPVPYEVRAVKGNTLTLDRAVGAGADQAYALLRPTWRRDGRRFDVAGLTVFAAGPTAVQPRSFPWVHFNGGQESTQGLRLEATGAAGELVTVLVPGKAPAMEPIEGGVRVGDDEIVFAGGLDAAEAAVVTVRRAGKTLLTLTGGEIDMNRPQGEIGLFVPDAGYPFGEIPDWLIRQRMAPPTWRRQAAAREETP